MIKIKYNDSDTFEEVNFSRNSNLVTISPTFPHYNGFTTWRLDGKTQLGDFSNFTTVYNVDGDSITYSNDGSVYAEPQPYELTVGDKINALKKELESTDYQAIKYAEGWFTEEDYAPIKAKREELREKIRELEKEIK